MVFFYIAEPKIIINNINKTNTIAVDDPQFVIRFPPFLSFKVFYGKRGKMWGYMPYLLHETKKFVMI